ncbi:MAG: NADH-quinone oxidoreductase subunit J [Halococcoides sp.]
MTLALTVALAAVLVGAIAAIAWPRPLGSILSLAGASVALAVAIFVAGYPIAAVFEAVVAAGLISLLFLFVVDLTDTATLPRGRRAAIAVLGVASAAVGIGALSMGIEVETASATTAASLWAAHPLDLLLVAVLVLVGVLGVVRLSGPGGETA